MSTGTNVIESVDACRWISSVKRAGSYGSKLRSAQYVSNALRKRSSNSGELASVRRTFHSKPSCNAECVRFDEPTYAVLYPELRSNSHALACKRVARVS